jgi:uncharacterized protein (TIGR02145 family)
MKKKTIFWTLTLLMLSPASVTAQVIIGGDGTNDPHPGALLDLSNSSLGLLLPNVILTNATDFVLVEEANPDIATIKTNAKGMVVYNIDSKQPGGLYLWTGSKWQIIAKKSLASITFTYPKTTVTKITPKNGSPNLSVTATGTGALTYQWKKSTDPNLNWEDVESDGTETSYAPPTSTPGTSYYRCHVSDGSSTKASPVFTVAVCRESIQDVDGNWYCTGTFGNAGTWMTTNLRTKKYDNGSNDDEIPDIEISYPNGDETILDAHPEYGLLYSLDAAMPDKTDKQGVCPLGWHVPNRAEWDALENEISTNILLAYSTDNANLAEVVHNGPGTIYTGDHGSKMKSTTPVVGGQETNGTSHSFTDNGFDALLVGCLDQDYGPYGEYAFFLDIFKEESEYTGFYLAMKYNLNGVNLFYDTAFRSSVRCIMDTPEP